MKDVDVSPSLMIRQVSPHARIQRSTEPFDDTSLGLLVVHGETTDEGIIEKGLYATVQEFETLFGLQRRRRDVIKRHTLEDAACSLAKRTRPASKIR